MTEYQHVQLEVGDMCFYKGSELYNEPGYHFVVLEQMISPDRAPVGYKCLSVEHAHVFKIYNEISTKFYEKL